MEIKGVKIQNEANYYKILSVVKNRNNVTSKEIKLLNTFLNGTETKEGVSVKLSTEAYTDTDFVLNTANTTFRLPIT